MGEFYNNQIYVTSWASYNEGAGRGGWIDLDVIDEDNFKQRMEEVGLFPDTIDEELVIHDYDDEEFGGRLYKMFGECYPLEVVKFYQKWINLTDDQKLEFIGLYETESERTALEALENEDLSNYLIMDEDAFTQFCEECLSCNFTDKDNWELVEKYIDWDSVKSDYSVDHNEFDYKDKHYYMREQ
jgi:hypothetical protein